MNPRIYKPTKSEIFTAYNHLQAALRKAGNEKAIPDLVLANCRGVGLPDRWSPVCASFVIVLR